MNWYLRKSDSTIFGPVDDAALRQWATEGRVAPEDHVSQDRQIWSPAHDLPELHMDWLIAMEDGSLYGPLHLSALRELLADGSLTPQTRLTHKTTGETQSLDQALAAPKEPVAQPAHLEAEQILSLGTEVPARGEWKEIAQSKDFFEREANKWRKMYEDEHASFVRRENALNERVNEMRKNELASRLAIEQMQRKFEHIERSYNTLKQTVESNSTDDNTTQLVALMESYQEMSLQFDTLMQQLTAKSQEIQTLIQSRAETEKRAEEQVKRMEDIVSRERAEADSARTRVAEMEENHLNLGKAYRDLNERFIRMREQNPSLRTGPAKKTSPGAEEASRGQPQIRLSRK
jgi:hypothetical protein